MKPYPFRLPIIFPLVLVALMVVAGLGMQAAFAGKVAPGTTLYNTSIAFRDAAEIQETYRQSLDRFEQTPVTVYHQTDLGLIGVPYTFTLAELGVTLKKDESVEGILIIGVGKLSWGEELKTQFTLDEGVLKSALEARIIDLNLSTQDAQLTWNANRKEFDILPEQLGWHGDLAAFARVLSEKITTLDASPISIPREHDTPRITAAQLETQKAYIKERIEFPLVLKGPPPGEDEWTLDWREHMDFLTLDPLAVNASTVTPPLALAVEPFKNHIAITLAPDLEVPAQDVTISYAEAENPDEPNEPTSTRAIQFEGAAQDGIAIDYDNLIHLTTLALGEQLTTVEIPTLTTRGKVNAPPDLQALGIKELVATGYSGFKTSPPGRRHNIGVAIAKFNGLLVQPGAIFSFGEHLGEVDGSTGYVKELVIREGETIPEYGGGVCQVSSTLFRAMLFGGFPIIERYPHSYAVTYYAYPLGWGLDATVYPPSVDLKFKNDMPTSILIQSFAEGNEATFKFYGTKDGRTVTMDGPYITDRKPAPPPIIVKTDTLPPGVKEKKDTAHNGFTATWYRTVTYPSGHPAIQPSLENPTPSNIQSDTIISKYIPWPERWLEGKASEVTP